MKSENLKVMRYSLMLTATLLLITSNLTAWGQQVDGKEGFGSKYAATRESAKNFDRNIDSTPFVEKGELLLGASISYGSFNASNAEMLLILEGIDASGRIVSVKPYVGYTYCSNNLAGVRFSYLDVKGTLDSSMLNMGESNDVELELPYIDVASTGYNVALVQRSYTSLDKKGRFGLFAELELGTKWGETSYTFDMENTHLSSFSKNQGYYLNFNPGASVYIFPNVSTTLSFGLGGVSYNQIKQYDQSGNMIGERSSAKASFKFNILAINLGFAVHIW